MAVGSKSGGATVVVLLPALSHTLSLYAMDREMGEQRPVASGRRSTTLCGSFNARRASSPVSLRATCSRPSQSSHGRKGPEALPPVALCRPGYLSSGQPFLVFLCTPPSLSNHSHPCFELLSPCHRLPPWPHLGTSVKAVPQSSSLSGFCSLSSLLLRWN